MTRKTRRIIMTSLTVTKVIAAVTLFFLTLISGIAVPSIFVLYKKYKRVDSLYTVNTDDGSSTGATSSNDVSTAWYRKLFTYQPLNKLSMYFGGGVLMATCFIHMIPEMIEDYANYKSEHNELDHSDSDENETSIDDHHGHGEELNTASIASSHDHSTLPVIELWICLGFFCLFLIEELVHSFTSHEHEDDRHQLNRNSTDTRSDRVKSSATNISNVATSSSSSLRTSSVDMIHASGSLANYTNSSYKSETASQDGSYKVNENHHQQQQPQRIKDTMKHEKAVSIDESDVESGFQSESIIATSLVKCSSVRVKLLKLKEHIVASLIILLAFSAHSIFDGVTIGVQSETSAVWKVFFAIASHKSIVSLALGMQLFEKKNNYLVTLINMILFSIMSPIGIVLTFATKTSTDKSVKSMIEIILSALATGTILYIVFIEILQRDRAKDPFKLFGLILFTSMILGFGVMFALTVYVT